MVFKHLRWRRENILFVMLMNVMPSWLLSPSREEWQCPSAISVCQIAVRILRELWVHHQFNRDAISLLPFSLEIASTTPHCWVDLPLASLLMRMLFVTQKQLLKNLTPMLSHSNVKSYDCFEQAIVICGEGFEFSKFTKKWLLPSCTRFLICYSLNKQIVPTSDLISQNFVLW